MTDADTQALIAHKCRRVLADASLSRMEIEDVAKAFLDLLSSASCPTEGEIAEIRKRHEDVETLRHASMSQVGGMEHWVISFGMRAHFDRATLLRLLESRTAAEQWRDIATAPRDGTAFLAYGVHTEDDPPGAARGVKKGDRWWAILLFDIWQQRRFRFAKDGTFPWSEPTHWCPLLSPPNTAGDAT